MNPDKKEIILREIAHWRSSRLLPEQYCDFLDNLYRDHDESDAVRRSSPSRTLTSLAHGNWKTWMLSFGIISFFFFIGIYFSRFAWPLQIGLTLLLTTACYAASGFYRQRWGVLSILMAGMGSILLLGMGSWILVLQDWTGKLAIPGLIAVCGLVWLLAGLALETGILIYCGMAAFALIYAFIFVFLHPEYTWYLLQAVWLPLSLLLFWLCWLIHPRSAMLARVCFGMAVTLWFMPEADYFLLRQHSLQGMEYVILIKIVFAMGILYGIRKKWVEWIAS